MNTPNEKIDVMAFGAHPDDIELMCAGTLIKLKRMGYKTGVVSLTKAELGTRGTPEIRKQENENSARILGLSVNKMLDIPDGGVFNTEENRIKVIEQIREHQPDILFVPYWETRHPDHGNTSVLVKEAAFLAGLKNIDTGQKHFRPAKLIYYMEMYDFEPSFIVDVSDSFEDKVKAIQSYNSQFHNPDKPFNSKDATYISSPQFLQSIIARGQYWGNKIGAIYGEPFLVREPIKINDPVRHFTNYSFAGLQ